MNDLYYSINAVLPVFAVIFAGAVFYRMEIIDDSFIKQSNRLVFNFTLPALVFVKIAMADFSNIIIFSEILLVYTGVIAVFFIAWIISPFFVKNDISKGPFIVGSFRGGIAIVGLAVAYNSLGEKGITVAVFMLAVLSILFHVLVVVALTVPLHRNERSILLRIAGELVKNPVIIAVLIALPFSYFKLDTGPVVEKSLLYLAALTLPLALIGIGATLKFSAFKDIAFPAIISSLMKLLMLPVIVTAAAIFYGCRNEILGVIFIFTAAPAAPSTYIMAHEMKNNSELSAAIIMVTTLGSIVVFSLGLYFLKTMGFL